MKLKLFLCLAITVGLIDSRTTNLRNIRSLNKDEISQESSEKVGDLDFLESSIPQSRNRRSILGIPFPSAAVVQLFPLPFLPTNLIGFQLIFNPPKPKPGAPAPTPSKPSPSRYPPGPSNPSPSRYPPRPSDPSPSRYLQRPQTNYKSPQKPHYVPRSGLPLSYNGLPVPPPTARVDPNTIEYNGWIPYHSS